MRMLNIFKYSIIFFSGSKVKKIVATEKNIL